MDSMGVARDDAASLLAPWSSQERGISLHSSRFVGVVLSKLSLKLGPKSKHVSN